MNTYTKSDFIETPWCYMPPEMHFDTPDELKQAFWAFSLSRYQDILDNMEMGTYFLPPPNKFEKVKDNKGNYILLPTTIDNSFLYRGQTEFFEECLPTLYRKKDISDEEIFIERIRCCEFEVYLKQYPQIEIFEKNKYNIDYLGLSQHYGLKTNVIDLTNSLDVALFFAMCNMSEDGKAFSPQREDKEYIGYIYAVRTKEYNNRTNKIKNFFDGRVKAIGMQPFYRPGNQRGFGMHLERGEAMTGLLYSFSYTKLDSENIYNTFKNGDILWHEDNISRVAREIKSTKTFSFKALNLAFKRYYKNPCKKQIAMKERLVQMGYTFQKRSLWQFDKNKLQFLKREELAKKGLEGLVDVIHRKMMDNEGHTKHCIDTQYLSHEDMVRFPISGCKAPEGYDSPYKFSESKDNIVWGYSQRIINQENQTIPNPITHKVDKWVGDWRTLKIDYNREQRLNMKTVIVPRKR